MGAQQGNKNASGPHGSGGRKSAMRAAAMRSPWQEEGEEIRSPKTVGENLSPYRPATPRLEGHDVGRFKSKTGVCGADGCAKIAGHSSPHTGR